jgi:hypothetical protein
MALIVSSRDNIIAEWLQTEARFLGERYGS